MQHSPLHITYEFKNPFSRNVIESRLADFLPQIFINISKSEHIRQRIFART